MKRVIIISTGNELLYGRVQDFNSYAISKSLFLTEFNVVLHITTGDVVEDLDHAVRIALSSADIVIITGGLGSTDDDKTLEVLQRIYGFETVVHKEGYEKFQKFLAILGRETLQADRKMLSVPEGVTVFQNEKGFAPGFALEDNGKLIIVMPGVPHEMQCMFENKVMPFLFDQLQGCRDHCIVRTVLMRESEINELIQQMRIPVDDIEWGITTTPGMNTITFVAKGGCSFSREAVISEARRIFSTRMLMPESENLEMEVLHLLLDNGLSIAIAESCTGGLISKRMTDIPGSSHAFLGSVVAYSNNAKIDLLGVSADIIQTHGAVSEEVAREMAYRVKEKFNAHIGISATGIAGPEGGTEEKPVGTVCFGMATEREVQTFTERIAMDRERVRFYASQYLLNKVRIQLLSIRKN
jgi:nicotinamide-nucleotide amidase